VKIKNRRDDASMLEMNDWFAELRDDGGAEPAADARPEPGDDARAEPGGDARAEPVAADARVKPAGHARAEPGGDARAEPAADARVKPAGHARTEPGGDGGLEPAAAVVAPPVHRPVASVQAHARVEASACAETSERAAIGDQLRIPIAWCEMGSCISHHADRAALGEADIRARAISADWRIDALGRLACPRCQQSGAGFQASHPVALWDRDAAITRALLMTAALRAGVFAPER
jgi:hypothetical protein